MPSPPPGFMALQTTARLLNYPPLPPKWESAKNAPRNTACLLRVSKYVRMYILPPPIPPFLATPKRHVHLHPSLMYTHTYHCVRLMNGMELSFTTSFNYTFAFEETTTSAFWGRLVLITTSPILLLLVFVFLPVFVCVFEAAPTFQELF